MARSCLEAGDTLVCLFLKFALVGVVGRALRLSFKSTAKYVSVSSPDRVPQAGASNNRKSFLRKSFLSSGG